MARQRQGRHYPQHRRRCDQPVGDAGSDRRHHVACVVERLVAADAGGETRAPDDSQADRGDGGGKHRVCCAIRHLCAHDRLETWPDRHRDGRRRNDDGRQCDQRSLGVQHVDKLPKRRARQHRSDSGDRQRHACRARLPMPVAG